MPLGQETILERLLKDVGSANPEHVTVSIGYLGHLVEAVIQDGQQFGLQVSYTREVEPLGTAGAINLIPYEVADDDVLLVLNGDTLTNIDFDELMTWFEGTELDAAMVCVERKVSIDFGVVNADARGMLIDIAEKPQIAHLLSTGINLLRGHTLKKLGTGRVDMPDFLMGLVASGGNVACHTTEALWMDLGRADDFTKANDMILDGSL